MFLDNLKVPSPAEFRALEENLAFQRLMAMQRAFVYDIKIHRSFSRTADENNVDLLLGEGLSLMSFLFEELAREVNPEEGTEPEEDDNADV